MASRLRDGSHLPLWPFGHGLSYTSFELFGLRSPVRHGHGRRGIVSLDVSNIGERAGDEVVQLYVGTRR